MVRGQPQVSVGDLSADPKRICASVVQSCISGPSHNIEDAVVRLRTFCTEREHVFWSDAVSIRERGRFQWDHVQGHRQLTDVYLLALAISNQGRLATFDSTISLKAIEGATKDKLELIPG